MFFLSINNALIFILLVIQIAKLYIIESLYLTVHRRDGANVCLNISKIHLFYRRLLTTV